MSLSFFLKSRRRNWLINPQFQIKFLAYTFGLAILCLVINYVAMAYYFEELRDRVAALGLPPGHLFYIFIDRQKFNMTMIVLGAGVAMLLIMITFGLLMSHRIAGPFYRLSREVAAMKEAQKLHQVNFRKKDFFQEVAQCFNEMAEIKLKSPTQDSEDRRQDEGA